MTGNVNVSWATSGLLSFILDGILDLKMLRLGLEVLLVKGKLYEIRASERDTKQVRYT